MTPPPASDLTARALLRRLALLAPGDRRLWCGGPEAGRIRAAAAGEGWSDHPEPRVALWFGPEAVAPEDIQLPRSVVALGIVDRGGAVPEGFREMRARAHMAYVPLHDWLDRVLPGPVRAFLDPVLGMSWFRETVSSRIAKLKMRGVGERWCVRGDHAAARDSPADQARDLAMSALGLGHLPLLAANWTSLATVLAATAALWLGGESAFRTTCALLALAATIGCVAFERWSGRYYLTADAREVTLDEVAGMAVTLSFLKIPEWTTLMPPASFPITGLVAAFLLFRFFDIFKPGIHWVEKTGWRGTIVWDDLLAGLYAGVVLRGIT